MPITHWSRATLADHLRAQGFALSLRTLGRVLDGATLQPHRQRMWLQSHDEDFRDKRDDVLRVYYETPPGEHIVCLDEKTQIQALERVVRDWPMRPGQPVQRCPEYVRHGTLVLMGMYDVRAGRLGGFVTERRGTEVFLELLDLVDACYPTGRGHIVCDNLVDHDNDLVAEWFDAHPRWTQHFTPKRASWLNQIEAAFADVQRDVITRGSFTSRQDLYDKVLAYLLWRLRRDRPFHWTYRPKSWQKAADTSALRH